MSDVENEVQVKAEQNVLFPKASEHAPGLFVSDQQLHGIEWDVDYIVYDLEFLAVQHYCA